MTVSTTPHCTSLDSATFHGADLIQVEPSHIHIPRPSRLNEAALVQVNLESRISEELELGLEPAA
jgi:hypothetical protein